MRFPHLDRTTRGLRGRAFVHAAADMAGHPHKPDSMAAWYLQCHPNLCSDVRKQWRRAFEGATLASWVREDLSNRFPSLRQVFDNPLWALMSESAAAMDWDELADTLPREAAKGPITCPSDRVTAGKIETRVYFSPFIRIVMQQHLGISVITRSGFK